MVSGTFNRIEHVILVGVGGGVPNINNESRHVRLGDIVVSHPVQADDIAYIHCKDITTDEDGLPMFVTKTWRPEDKQLNDVITQIQNDYKKNAFFGDSWQEYIREAESELQGGDMRFTRPAPDSDKLYRIHDNSETSMEHPKSPSDSVRARFPDQPVLHAGPVGTGKPLVKDDKTREEFAARHGVLCVDSGFQAVLDSIDGNRKESFALIRGVSDYEDGAQRREWQPYASLVAAAFMKSVLMRVPWPHDSDSDDD